MYPFHSAHGRGGHPPPPQQNFPINQFQNPNLYHTILQQQQFIQNPHINTFPQFHPPHFQSNPFTIPTNNNNSIEKLDKAAVNAHREFLALGDTVSAWKVSSAALKSVNADSWESLGFQMQQVPSLNKLLTTEGKVNGFIHCFVAVREITSLYDLGVAVCESEGVGKFEELGLGPLLRHPLVVHYFGVSCNVTTVYRITTEEIVSYLSEFVENRSKREVKIDTFLEFIAKERSVGGSEKLCVRIQNLGLYIKKIREAKLSLYTVLNKCFESLRSKAEKRSKKRPLFSVEKKQLDDHFSSISQRIQSFSSENKEFCGKHIRFESSSSDDHDSGDDESEDSKAENNYPGSNTSDIKADRVSSCPYPSVTEEKTRLGLKTEANYAPGGGARRNNDTEIRNIRKRKSENVMSTTSPSYKQAKRDKSCVNHKNKSLDNKDDQCTDGDTISKEESPMFVTIWKEACQSNTAEEVVERMLRPYRMKGKRRVKELFTKFPFVGLLNVALAQKGKFYANHKNKHLDNNGSEDTDGYSLSSEKLLKFVEAWRDSFRSSNTNEVFQRMLKTYKTERRKKMKTMFTTYPFVGLLNAAVSSINSGMWDNMYDTFQVMALDDNDVKKADSSDDYISIAIEPAKEGVSSQKIVERKQVNVTAECIAKEIFGYFEDEILDHKDLTGENNFSLLRKLCKCQSWLNQRYSITEFESLGYGEYFSFTQKHINLLPRALQNFFMGQTYENMALDARMLQPQLDVLLSQALSSTWENKNINLKTVAELLARQFPLVCFKLMASDLQENYLEGLREKVCKITSNCLLFSTPLLKSNCLSDSLVVSETNVRGTSDLDYAIEPKEGLAGAVTTKDAIEVLLKAPMLTNLILWSHWDLLFAPSLGSITEWFFKEVNTKELLCLVTKDGKIIRLDHSATLDSFLKVFIGGYAFETAVHLLSLLALYGGERSVPLSLLKCHAQKAFEVIVKNSSDIESEYNNHKNPHNETARVVSRFVLECLSYLPIEFCSFAADILLAGLQSLVKGVPLAILNDCKQIEQRLILHEVGFSLGVIEWVNDYHSFCFSPTSEFPHASSGVVTFKAEESSTIPLEISNRHPPSSVQVLDSDVGGVHCFGGDLESSGNASPEVSDDGFPSSLQKLTVLNGTDSDPVRVIESIREEEFGLNQSLSDTENRMLEKQHARLGRALHCLSQELYSQDSHFLLELVQNADDNIYPGNVEPTLMFILQEKGIVILNNEKGFSANNIRALCDVGNSTKKGHSAGYIGKKGIGFKSVFRVTDAPEIHSNGYHVKFDITQGQIGFVLPTIVPACDVNLYSRLASPDATSTDQSSWSTCIVLPFRSNSTEGFGMNNIISMFSDLHPSLLLFLHRLQCMKFRNVLDDSLIVMRKQVIGNGMVRVAVGNERMTWLVISKKLQADVIRSDVQTTEISLAFTLQETEDGGYTPILKQQPAFAFLPLRTYGLKFIIQGDFVLPSSREEVDSNSPWNQWLLSEFPDFFVSAERSFCGLPCYRGSIGKAITAYMSFIPVVGEVHGFFSSLPRMIVSKLRMSNCLVLEGNEDVWVPPCKVLRNWSEQTRSLLSDGLLQEHLGLGFLNKDIILSDILARTLGVEEYGPKILLNIISSISCSENGLKSMGLSWLSSCLSAIYVMLSHSSETSSSFVSESDFISSLKKIPLVPVSDGKFCSVDKETIWLHSEEVGHGVNEEYVLKAFPKLYAMLLIVSPNLLSAACSIKSSCSDTTVLENVVKMLYKVGVQRLSAHEILKEHILPAISDDKNTIQKENLMIEYLSFAMFHLQSNCASCSLERDDIITELRNKCLILTNYGYRRSNDVPIHFSREYNSPIDTNRLVTGLDMKWHEIDPSYLKHPITNCLSDGVLKWRTFFQDIGVTDFVQIVEVEKRVADIPFVNIKDMIWCRDTIATDSMAKDWESEELCLLLSQLSSKHDPQKSMNLMEILDVLWDGYFNDKCAGHYIDTNGESKAFKSSLISILQDVPWVVSSIDNKLHYPKDLFHDCVSVSSILGSSAPYTTPKVKSEKLVADLGIKTQVTIDDALSVLRLWKRHSPFQAFKASVSQMSNFYEFLWKGMASSKKSIIEELQSGRFVFVPYTLSCSNEDIVRGQLLTSQEVYWRDSTENAESVDPGPVADTSSIGKTLYNLYPTLHDFFVNECEVNQNPPLRDYLQILLQLSSSALPHESGKRVYKIFLKWADALNSGLLSPEDADYMKESLLRKEYTVLPTRLDRWVSLHVSFGLVCWCDDGGLGKEFKNAEKVDFLYFGDYTDEENQMLHAKLSIIMQKIGIPVLSKIVTREAIYHGKEDCTSVYSMVNWILPFAQRYVYNAHPEKYFQLKQSAFKNLRHLKIVVVENLFYRNIIKSCDVTSKKRHECDCLLQDNILYCSKGLNTHAIFLELSRLLYDGAPDLHFANFLHMITTMAESGATEEQTEFFIQNSQKVPKLPSEESSWSIQLSSVETDAPLFENYIPASQRDDEKNYLSKRKPGTISNWPPANWKTAPGFNSSSTSELKKQTSIGMQITEANFQVENLSAKEICDEVNIARDKAVATSTGTGLVNSEILEPANLTTNFDASGTDMELDSVDLISPEGMSSVRFRSNSNETNDISARQAQLTGRMGEFVAFKYFEGKAGEGSVKWVNEGNETGLPYDVVIGNDDDSREYIEVKATKYARKNWFLITMREWQFAIEKGEAFSIAHVTLGDDNMARVTVYKNPAKLCQIGNLKLAVVVPKE